MNILVVISCSDDDRDTKFDNLKKEPGINTNETLISIVIRLTSCTIISREDETFVPKLREATEGIPVLLESE